MSQELPKPAETVTRAMLKAGPGFSVGYTQQEGDLVQGYEQKFYTQEANDAFANAMELMGVNDINKSYYDPLTRKWLPYTDRIFYTESI